MSNIQRREVVTHPAIFRNYNRPYLIVSSDVHPDYPDQHIALGITTEAVTGGLQIEDRYWELGSLSHDSFIDPRYPAAISEQNIVTTVGVLTETCVERAVNALAREIGIAL